MPNAATLLADPAMEAAIDAVIDAAIKEVNHHAGERSTGLGRMSERFRRVRRQSQAIAEPLSAEDCCVQSMPDASPIKWHLAHTTWFFETFILERFESGFHAFHPQFRVLYNSYYEGVGEKFPRPQRGLLTRPSLEEVQAYRANVDHRMLLLIDAMEAGEVGEVARGVAQEAAYAHLSAQLPDFLELLVLGLQHEQQHQELMLTDVKHLLSINPLKPAYLELPEAARSGDPAELPLQWHRIEAGVVEIGHEGEGFCFDNETPRHRQFVEAYQCASRLVNNAEYQAFVEDGGYRDSSLWLSEGWEWRKQLGLEHPIYWQRDEAGRWSEFTEYGLQNLEPHRAAVHLSYYEADAYARWADARLLSEAEWEHAAGRMQGSGREFFGVAWQWTSSSYAPYPGYAAPQGAVGEYNGKFMVNQYVLRGSSSATPLNHARLTYRNFFPAYARWQVTGIRLARSI